MNIPQKRSTLVFIRVERFWEHIQCCNKQKPPHFCSTLVYIRVERFWGDRFS